MKLEGKRQIKYFYKDKEPLGFTAMYWINTKISSRTFKSVTRKI